MGSIASCIQILTIYALAISTAAHYLCFMFRKSIITGSLLAGLAVILGAFGAHGLKDALSPENMHQLQSYETAVKYQMYHAFAIIILGIIAKVSGENKYLTVASWFFSSGIIFFSGSIYILSTRSITGLDWTWLGPITPIGGFCFIVGWALTALALTKK